MKISVTQHNVTRWGEDRYKKLREIGFEAIDFSNNLIVDHLCSDEEYFPAILAEKKLIEEAGLEVYQAHGPWRFPPRDGTEEDRADRLHKMQLSIRASAMLGCKNWIIHPIMPFGYQDIPLHKEEETKALNLAFFKELAKTAHEYGVTICLENMPMPQFSIATPQDILDMIEALDDDCFGMCLDVGHVAVIPGLQVAEEVYRVKDVLRAVHIHDNLGKVDQHFIPYFGVVDWEAVGKALRDIDFKGAFSLEVEAPKKLPDPYFEEMFRLIFKIAKHIADGN